MISSRVERAVGALALLVVGCQPSASPGSSGVAATTGNVADCASSNAGTGSRSTLDGAKPDGGLTVAEGEGVTWTRRGERDILEKPATARTALQRACDLSEPKGCTLLAGLLLTGIPDEIPRDEKSGVALMEKGCKLGSREGCRLLGNLYQQGSLEPGAFPQDTRRAFGIYRETCRAGDAYACASLAHCYDAGLGVERDAKLARQYRWMADELGYVGE
jgi:TPR repeat protein